MNYKITTLKNGLRVITVPIPSIESASITLWVGVGSRFEEDSKAGVSHFLEHVVFKGSKKFPTPGSVSLAIDSIGAEANAGTSHEWTDFYIKSQKNQVKHSFGLLTDVVLYPLLKDSAIKREKGVIIEEISMHKDNPMERLGDIFMNLAFSGNSLGRDVVGNQDTIIGLNRDDFETFRQKYYNSQNMILTVSGNFEEDQIFNLAQESLGNLPTGIKEKPKIFENINKKPKLKVEFKDTEQAHILIGFYSHNRTHKDRFAEGILGTILGKGMSSRLFTEVREKKGLAYAVGTSISRFIDTGVFATYAGVHPKKAIRAIEIILKQIYGIDSQKYPLKEKEIIKAKEFIKGKIALALEDTIEVNEFFGQNALFQPEIYTPEEYFKMIDKVNLDDIMRVVGEIFVPGKMNMAIVGPYKDDKQFAKILAS